MKKSQFISNLVLFLLAFFFKVVIFIIDLNVSAEVAIGAVYCIVILYSWLLPGKTISLISAFVCTIFVIIGLVYSENPNPGSDTYIINRIISIIAIWICAFLVAIAKRSFDGLEEAKADLEGKVLSRTKELNKFNTQLINKNKELEQFAFIASHDLQEPLQTILNFTDLLERDYKNEISGRGIQYIGFISSSSLRMRNVINALLDYSRIGRSVETAYIDCNELLNEMLVDMNHGIEKSKAKITIHPLPTIHAYKVELRLLFQNLISNAIKFQEKGNIPTIEIACIEKMNSWRFSIKDNGIGIQEEFKEKIFIIFQQLNIRGKYEGTGIGLAHCRKIIDLHGGLIWVKANENEGSTFYFTIPKLSAIKS